MNERCSLAATEIASLQVINRSTVAEALSNTSSLRVTRIVVTDEAANLIFDSYPDTKEKFFLFPEIIRALSGYDVFNWSYSNGVMVSKAASPIMAYGSMVGCVYMMESDAQQGSLLQSLQVNTFTISIVLEIILIIFSFFFSKAFTARLKKIMVSIGVIREGDYTHKVVMGGNDELTVLGDEFNTLVEKLYTSENKRRQFVSDASHELKTPLASIKLLSDSILQNEMDIETIREFVADIGNEAERLNRMSEKLLTLSYIEREDDSDFIITMISPTIERVVRMISAIAAKKQIQIHMDLANDSPILVHEDDLYQIIFNLAENAIKYNKEQGHLTIGLSRNEDMAILTIADSGVGIPEESLPHIFERFYRVDKARSRESGGSGLGLSIVRNIVLRNHGTIEVKSTVGVGTTFTVSFPVFETEETT